MLLGVVENVRAEEYYCGSLLFGGAQVGAQCTFDISISLKLDKSPTLFLTARANSKLFQLFEIFKDPRISSAKSSAPAD